MASTRFLAPDLTQLTPPQLIEEVDFEVILAEQKAWTLARWDEVRAVRPDLPALDTLGLETEPMTIILESYAFRETLVRALVNDKARAVLLAYAVGSDLDAIGAFFSTYRMTVVAADPANGVAAIMEDDDRFRRRIQLAPEAFSTCGPRGAYIYWALTLTTDIADAWAYSPSDGRVNVVVSGPNGADVSDDILGQLVRRYADEDIVPLTDRINVYRAVRQEYAFEVTAFFARGPDPTIIETAVETSLRKFASENERIAATIYRNAGIAASKIASTDNVLVTSPSADVVCDDDHIPHLTGVIVHPVILGD